MGKRGSITYQIQRRLCDKLEPGTSKHEDKMSGLYGRGQSDPEKIYSHQTLEDYMRISNRFARWAQEQHGKVRDLDDLRPYASEWLRERQEANKAASTLKQDRAALAKLFGCAGREIIEDLPLRERQDFTKNRTEAWRGHYSKENHPEITMLAEGAGTRRHEMQRLTPDQVVRRDDGRVWIEDVRGKGGKIRDIPVRWDYGDKIMALADEARAEGRDRLLSDTRIPDRAPIHDDRGREYAVAIYLEHARPIEELTRKEIYFGRKELRGCRWDKAALQEVTKALGHGRLNVVANYLRQSAVSHDAAE